MKFELGDKVCLVAINSNWATGERNPFNILGEIITVFTDGTYEVKWSNGEINRNYTDKHLTLVECVNGSWMKKQDKKDKGEQTMLQRLKGAADSVANTIKPYKEYIFWGALLIVADYFLFDMRYTKKLQKLVEALAERIVKMLDDLTDKLSIGPASETSTPETKKED